MDAPKRIYAWSVPPTAHLVGTWSVTRYPDAAQEYILASDHARIVAEKDAEIERLRDARILVLPHGHTGVCVGGRFNGWLMRRHPDGQWVTVVKLPEVDPTSGNPDAYSLAGVCASEVLGDDNG